MAPNGPIGSESDKILGLCHPSDQQGAVPNWYLCLSVLSAHDQRARLLSQLSSMQVVSLRLLEEWWWYGCDDKGRSEVIAGGGLPQWDPSDARYLYKKKLYHLWYWEFTNVFHEIEAGSLELRMAHLGWVRQTAAEAGAVDRMALAAYNLAMRVDTTHTSQTSAKLSPMGQSRLECHIPACVEPCPWIGSARLKKEYPYYLWDKQEQKTVHFDESCDIPPYTVISHTWGRYRLGSQATKLRGVPWEVPCLDPSRLFDIRTLPYKLSQFPVPTRYVWFDLVCIPQDGRPLQNIEIGRQAGIFMTAKFAVVWLNQIRGWDGLRAAITWTALEYLSRDNQDRYGVTALLGRVRDPANRPSTLTVPSRKEDEGTKDAAWTFEDQENKTVTPDRWFTSLWTLQEACLRPDMVVCDKDWSILSIGEEEFQMPILLDHVIALFERPRTPRLNSVPASVYELKILLSSSGLRTLLSMSPVDILIIGEMRYCEDTNRAKAVMSALGTTDWYTQGSPGALEQDPKELVLGKYPLTFLQECQRRIGSLFFYSVAVHNLDDVFYEDPVLDNNILERMRGSLLPFSTGVQDPRVILNTLLHPEDHPAVSQWLIERDGSVHISHVGILASYFGPDQYPTNIEADIRPPRKGFRLPPLPDKLHDWMASFRPKSEKHAICLFRNLGSDFWGVILERVDPKKNDFVSVGTFDTPKHVASQSISVPSFQKTVEVNWRVL